MSGTADTFVFFDLQRDDSKNVAKGPMAKTQKKKHMRDSVSLQIHAQ